MAKTRAEQLIGILFQAAAQSDGQNKGWQDVSLQNHK